MPDTTQYNLPSENSFPTLLPLAHSPPATGTAHTSERYPPQDLCIDCLFYPEHSFLRQLSTATTSEASSKFPLPGQISRFSWHYVCPSAKTQHADHGVLALALPPINLVQQMTAQHSFCSESMLDLGSMQVTVSTYISFYHLSLGLDSRGHALSGKF